MPRKPLEIVIEPEVLKWARESIGLKLQSAAQKIKVSEDILNNWEGGKGKPTLKHAERMAFIYNRPLAAFLLSAPPKEPPPLPDFRTKKLEEKKPLIPKTLLAIRKARRLQISAIELHKELGYPISPFSEKATSNEIPEVVAEKVRTRIVPKNFNVLSFENSDEAFEGWKKILEDNGVLVFQVSIPQHEIKGFSLIEGELPAIVVNKTDEINSKIFSLFHELSHIILEVGGICDMYEDAHSPATEKFCNHFAGSFLVPAVKLLRHPLVIQNRDTFDWSNKNLKALADEFKVSREVILRRLLILNKTTSSFYGKWREENAKDYKPFGKGGKNPAKISIQERGKKYVGMVFDAYGQSKINVLDVADYLGVKINQIPKVKDLSSK